MLGLSFLTRFNEENWLNHGALVWYPVVSYGFLTENGSPQELLVDRSIVQFVAGLSELLVEEEQRRCKNHQGRQTNQYLSHGFGYFLCL